MSETRFTKGPWSLKREGTPFANNRVWPATGRDPICSLSSFGSSPADIDPEAQANGHLIAAAPELYEALKEAAIFLEVARKYCPNESLNEKLGNERLLVRGLADTMAEKIKQSRATLAKARDEL